MAVIETMEQWREYYRIFRELSRHSRYDWKATVEHLPSEVIEREKSISLADISHEIVRKIFINEARGINEHFTIDKDNNDVIDLIIMWLRRDEAFLKVNPSYQFEKSLAITGPVGTGKTLMFKILARFLNVVPLYSFYDNSFKESGSLIVKQFETVTANELNRRFSIDGNKIFYNVSGEKAVLTHQEFVRKPLFVDDIGTEGEASHYGVKMNLISELIQLRYEAKSLTYFTSNLGQESLKELYGIRAYDRLREMVNVIPLTGNSRRK